MNTYQVILEGSEKEEEGYFITMTVHAESDDQAMEFALGRAEERGLQVLRVEDIELTDEGVEGKPAGVAEVHDREFFDWEEEGYTEREVGEDGELHPVDNNDDNQDDDEEDEYY